MTAARIPDWVTFPEDDWVQITPQEAGLDPNGLSEFLAGLNVEGNDFGGEVHQGNDWGCVITRGGYLVHTWGDGSYRFQTASMGKSFTFALVGLAAQEGLLDPDEPINRTWTGEGELSHPHKHLDRGHHKSLTWRHLAGRKHVQGHFGGFPIEVGYHWKMGRDKAPERWAATIPEWANWTGDPFFDNYAHIEPGAVEHYSSGGFWRLSQPLTHVWDRDLKEVMDERIMGKIGIPPERWDWLTGQEVQQDSDFYPLMPNAWDYLDPPYEVNGHTVRSGPGWVVMSAKDLARFGLLVATEGNWKGEQLLDPQWVRGHGGGNGSGQSGESTYYTSMGMVTTRGIDYRHTIATESFIPGEIFTGPVKVARTV